MNLIVSKEKYYCRLLIISFLFLLMSKSLAGSVYSTLFSIGLICVLFFEIIVADNIRFKKSIIHILFWFYILLFIVSLIRQYFHTDLSFKALLNVLLFFLNVVLAQVILASKLRLTIGQQIKLLSHVLNAYILLNFLCYILGFEKARYAGQNSILGLFDISVDRVFFIFSPSMAYFGMICGISCLVTLFFWLECRKPIYFFCLVISFIALILTDSRGPIFGLLIILILIFGIRRLWIRNQLLLFLFFIFSVSLFFSVMLFLDTYIFDLEQLSRENTTLLSWRDVIWEIFFKNYDPSISEFLFGYGNVGQFISGISSEYEYLFSNWPNPRQISLHNNTLQMLVDVGFIGILSFFVVLYYVAFFSIRQYKHSHNKMYLIVPGIINYILLLGFSDIVMNISNIGVYFALMFIIINTLYSPKTNHLNKTT